MASWLTDIFSAHTITRPEQGAKLFGQCAVVDHMRSDEVLPLFRRNHRITPRLVIYFLGPNIDVITWRDTCSLSSLNPPTSMPCGGRGQQGLVLIP